MPRGSRADARRPRPTRGRPIVTALSGACTLVVMATLLAAGVGKLKTFSVFREQVADYRLLPYRASATAAAAVTALEFVSVCLLAVPASRLIGAASAAVLFAVFLIVVLVTWARGRTVACACFGGSGALEKVGLHTAMRTGLLLVLALAAGLGGGDVTLTSLPEAVLLAIAVFLIAEVARLLGEIRQGVKELVDPLLTAQHSTETRGT